ncbi:MAG: type 1 glutamine amidotransferase [Sulfuricella sp.]|nr:type 1 glutamine amidotransferase [Sulfuricella sp.]
MKPVAIFRHAPSEGPGYFATFLEQHSIPWQLFKSDAGEAAPASARDYSGLVFMGGPMSVNDDLPWIPATLALIRAAREAGIPLLGHCLGGQLIAKALGGSVGRNPLKEIGWGEVELADTPQAREWFGNAPRFTAFHWHGETFTLPDGAELLLSSPHCRNQAYLLDGKHLGMQCHIEMTAEMVETWSTLGADEIAAAAASPAVQTPAAMREDLAARVAVLNRAAAAVYGRWIKSLKA